MSEAWSAFFVGCIFMSIVCGLMHYNYKKILVMKAKDKSAEHINGSFYYIVPEEEYVNEKQN